ncbi:MULTISPECIES: dihydropteroate synthase [Dehalobacter]|uniref:Dihydropteroate synthase n=1 Tax=Dehalobacter restrictus TaxID=55583 RepID=A0A857DDS3_9FIRM|nr:MULTISPECIES: dihydropteroate synthase [Dehalobacter]MCG1025706.1 dihydropteroate synthase [Dehalobacter sp.]MDJ0305480.1 dihydropteroate synthase [Dehalobacter sp.]QGZ99393.1 dihydropteroate synthase [Dehalobacter restrictus]
MKDLKAYNMRWLKIDSLLQAERALSQVGVDPGGLPYMNGKALTKPIKLENVPAPVALVLKQEMLSSGGDAAVHKDLLDNGAPESDVLLIGTYKQLTKLADRLATMSAEFQSLAQSLCELMTYLEEPPAGIIDCRGKSLIWGQKTLIMGILNVTPDSFSDGGKFDNIENALKQAEKMVADGADMLDIGGESTRPGYGGVSAEEEWSRLEPVLKALIPVCSVPISIDTQKAAVAAKSLRLGAHIINDIWGLQKDPEMAGVIAEYQAPVVIMHNQDHTEYKNMMGEILSFLERSIEMALDCGLTQNQIIVDPGIGFGKTPEQNMEVLSRMEEFKSLGCPLLLGVSRKSVIGRTLNLPVDQRLEPTIALGTLGIVAGADILRVHDVPENKKAALITDLVIRRKRGEDYEGK